MAGDSEAYDHLPFFYSDLFDLGYEAVGELDPRLETVNEVEGVLEPGVVYYVDGERRTRGVLLWNLIGRVDDARALIRARAPVGSGALGERVA
jgi:3-phenylpropionate/trans-cinnamate dioxygenase ferredoxin reductase subunit